MRSTRSHAAFRLSDRVLLVLLAGQVALALMYFVLVEGWRFISDGLGLSAGGFAVLVALPTYSWILWRRREEHIALDYHMLYLPMGVWLATTLVVKFVVWQVTRGQAFFLTYGWDKGIQNLLLEPAIVVVVSGAYLARFLAVPRGRAAARLAAGVVLVSALIAVFFPPLGE